MVTDAASARERVRLILDRANSPWLTNNEINGFIEMSINEYLRERVGMFGANQKLRDDFGRFVKSLVYSAQEVQYDEDANSDIFRRQYLNYNEQGNYVQNIVMSTLYPGGEWTGATDTNGIGTACAVSDNYLPNDADAGFSPHFGYLLEIKCMIGSGSVLRNVKVLSIDKALAVSRDPFHTATGEDMYHAVRINDIYYIRPGVPSNQVMITYVSGNNDVDNIEWLPTHGREEVCQIAARKIMGTVADERMPAADNEIKQLEGK